MMPVEWAAFMITYPGWWLDARFQHGGISGLIRRELAKIVIAAGIPIQQNNDPVRHASLVAALEKRIKTDEGVEECAQSNKSLS